MDHGEIITNKNQGILIVVWHYNIGYGIVAFSDASEVCTQIATIICVGVNPLQTT